MPETNEGAEPAQESNSTPTSLLGMAEAGMAPEPTAPTPPPAPPAPTRLDDVDILAIENLDLKIRNQQLTLQQLEHQKQVTLGNISELARALEMKRVELTKKYGRPVRRDTVTADGAFIPIKS